jgi:hypothetical protein
MRRLALAIPAACLAMVAAALALLAAGAGERTPGDGATLDGAGGVAFAVAALAFGVVGGLIARRAPANPIGWIFGLTGLLLAASDLAFHYAMRMLFIAEDPWPGGAAAALFSELGQPLTLGLLALALMLFPDGRLPSRRWRPVAWLAVGGMVLLALSGLRPGALSEPLEAVTSPLDLPIPRGLAIAAGAIGWLGSVLAVGIAGLGIPVRLRRARGVEREQLKWLALAAAVAGVAVVADVVIFLAVDDGGSTILTELAFALFPVAAGAAILRHRLYDVDLVINRALVYGALTALLAGAYVAMALLLGLALSPLTGESDLAIALSTLAVAALFRPARARVQRLVDRRFYRHKYDAERTLAGFAARLRAETDLEALRGALTGVVRETMQPAHVSLWLRPDRPS